MDADGMTELTERGGKTPAREERPAGLLLMGGRSRRFGTDKAQLLLATEPDGTPGRLPLYRRQLAVLEAVADPVWRAVAWGSVPGPGVLVDEAPDAGPLPAIGRALCLGPAWWVVLAVDLPGVTAAFLRRLWDQRVVGGIVLPSDGERRQPLAAVWHRDTVAEVDAVLRTDTRRVQAVLERVPVREVLLSEEDRSILVNINTPADWERWQRDR
jgi:molybdopterin-guanine dinucleotide biosynthesis protein A